MLNFLPHEQTFGLALMCLLWYLFIYYLLRPAKSYPYILDKTRYYFAVVLVLVLCVFFFSISDWFGYYIEFIKATNGSDTHMESIYEWLAKFVTKNYLVWRFMIWGIALFLMLLCIKRLPISPFLTMLVFVVLMFTRFAYTRTTLAYSLMFFGCALLSVPNKKWRIISYMIGFSFIGCSYFFHKSALFGIGMIVVAFVIRKIDWKIILLLVILIPTLLFVLRNQISSFLMLDLTTDEGDFSTYLQSGQSYLVVNQKNRGIGSLINDILTRGPIIIMAFVCLLQCNNNNIPREIRLFMRVNVLIVIGALLCLFDLGANTYILYYRFLNYAAMPSVFCFSYLYSNRYYPKLLKLIFYMALVGSIYSLAYVVYDRYVSGPKLFGF